MDFTRNTRWLNDGHNIPDTTVSNFAGFVCRESAIIAFTYADLNDLDVYFINIQKAYLVAPTSEKTLNKLWR